MLNKIALLSTLFFLIFGANVFAHSHLEYSTPKNGEIVTETLKAITLTFETKIEPTSSFVLLNEKNDSIPLSTISINGNQLIANVEANLMNGSYTIHWKIIGEDGHPLEGDIPFTIQMPENAASPIPNETQPSAAEVTTAENTPVVDTTVLKDQATDVKEAALDEPKVMNYVLPAIIGLIIVFGFGSYWLIFRRKQV
ncbi:copper resistance CopC family protein [Neobacillus sp. DY30]|uniref:copper resistance CopC family protein n=1 Tax=Neobacillus sp. DY30 TaxID=3047871 RepID=UPI0024C05609|nr:copper resistance CopC family protein [Neobacillus sp. DY30]WHY01652.1 copper resistance protein CopC [Neobacillus sp. DY30]